MLGTLSRMVADVASFRFGSCHGVAGGEAGSAPALVTATSDSAADRAKPQAAGGA